MTRRGCFPSRPTLSFALLEVVFGVSDNGGSHTEPLPWTASGGIEGLGGFGSYAGASDVSASGSIIGDTAIPRHSSGTLAMV